MANYLLPMRETLRCVKDVDTCMFMIHRSMVFKPQSRASLSVQYLLTI